MQVRSGYINPLAMQSSGKTAFSKPFPVKRDTVEEASDLRQKQQQIQNTLLLLKATGTDSAVSTAEQQEQLQEKLQEVSVQLQTAERKDVRKTAPSAMETAQNGSSFSPILQRRDTYAGSREPLENPGIYQIKRVKNGVGYRCSFTPYSG